MPQKDNYPVARTVEVPKIDKFDVVEKDLRMPSKPPSLDMDYETWKKNNRGV